MRVRNLQSSIHWIALDATPINSQYRELRNISPIHELIYLVCDHTHYRRDSIRQGDSTKQVNFCGILKAE